MDFPALAQRVIYPRTHTMDAAWVAAANSGYAGAIMAAIHLLWVGRLLSTAIPLGPIFFQLGLGFAYIVLTVVAFRRSRIASIGILALIMFEALAEIVFALGFRPSQIILLVALVLAIGGLRGANAIFMHIRQAKSEPQRSARR